MGDVIQKDQPKKKKKTRVWVHFLLWGVMVLFLFAAPEIKDRLTIVKGKPVAIEPGNQQSEGQIRYAIDKFDQVKIDNQMLYRAIGWSFIESDPDQAKYEVYLVCRNDHQSYHFLTIPGDRADVESAFPDFAGDLSKSGFNVLIAKDTMKNGTYEVGFLYVDTQSGAAYYTPATAVLHKSFNDIQLEQ